ncbi:MAG: hypothetical protein HYY18_03120 [Planctomycetes bacterium]|nr:hypothetical protein [Planctomycetota bacterium]
MAALALTGCEKPTPGLVPAVNLVKVVEAGDIQPGSTRITLTASRELRREGVPATFADLPERVKGPAGVRREHPILIEADASLKIRDLIPLLESLLAGNSVNLSFLVATDRGPRALTFPVIMEHFCHDLWYWDGSREHHDSRAHLWIELRPDPLRLVSVTTDREPRLVSEEPELRQPQAWSGDRPPDGPCSEETLKTFLGRPDVAALSPFIRLRLIPEDSLDSAFSTLSALRHLGASVLPEVHDKP